MSVKNLFNKLNLTQKVAVTIIALFVITCISMALVVSQIIRRSYLNEQKRSVSQFVLKQATHILTDVDFQKTDLEENRERFDAFRSTISTPDVVKVTIFNTNGSVLSSDDPALIGKQLFVDGIASLAQVFGGATSTSIDKPSQLLKIYTPLIFDDINVVGAVEVTTQLASLNTEIARSQTYTLGVLAAIISIAFILLYIIIRRASITLVEQEKQLRLDIQKEQEYSKLKIEFIALASHQLRTPAATIMWTLELLSEDIESKLSSEQKDLTKSARLASQTLIEILNNMLIVTEIKSDYFTFETKNYFLEDLIHEIINKNKKYLANKGQKVTFQNKAGGMELNLKRSALILAIESVYKNAIDYSPVNSEISITLVSKPDFAVIEIIDNGIGIPVEERNKVFVQFFRATNSIEQKNVGSGLSLYIAHKIVTGYGGTLQYTALEKGSKFVLSIPLAPSIDKQ